MKKHLIYIAIGLLVIGLLDLAYWQGTKRAKAPVSTHNIHSVPGVDATKRYTVSFSSEPKKVAVNQDAKLTFKVYDAATGSEVMDYATLFEKPMHLVVVDSGLKYFNHIHPTVNGSEFSVTTKFPQKDLFRLYLNFQPSGAAEQQIGFTLPVGGGEGQSSSIPIDDNLTKVFGNVRVALSSQGNTAFKAQSLSDAAQVLNFQFTDNQTGQPLTDLEPYLGAFGHLIMINEQTYQYVHIHPIASDNPVAGGPEVKFLPAALFEPIRPGIYRMFGEFKRNGKVFVADFTIRAE